MHALNMCFMSRGCMSLCILLFVAIQLQAQAIMYPKDLDRKCTKMYMKAKQNQKARNYKDASKAYAKLLKKFPRLVDVRQQQAAIAYQQGRISDAASALSSIIEEYPDYDDRNYLSLATIYREENKYAEAVKYYKLYIDRQDEPRERTVMLYEEMLFRSQSSDNAVDFDPIPLSDKINTTDLEYEASFTADESQMVFTRRINNQEDFYMAQLEGGEVVSVSPIEELNTPIDEGAHSISSDGSELFFTVCISRNNGGCDLYLSQKVDDKWTRPKNLGQAINTEYWDSQPSISGDGRSLYFSSNRPGGLGGRDIWYAHRRADGRWSKAINLGAEVNSSSHDETPFIHKDNLTLYFASDRQPGMGQLDLYSVSRNHWSSDWNEPNALPYPINTEAAEAGLKVSLDGTTAYFATDRNLDNKLDLYEFDLPEGYRPKESTLLKFKVIDEESEQVIVEAAVTLTDLTNADSKMESLTDASGEATIPFPKGQSLAVNVAHDDYAFYSYNIAADQGLSEEKVIIRLVPLKVISELPAEKAITLNNIFYASGSAELLDESEVELDYLYNLLQDHPGMEIKIIGHTDDIGSKEDNLSLSINRAKSVYDALIQKGITPTRIQYEGKGESAAIVANETEEQRQVNRRTEFVILRF